MFHDNIYDLAIENSKPKEKIGHGKFCELYVISYPAGGESGNKTHPDEDKVYVVVEGQGSVVIDGKAEILLPDELLILTAGTTYNIKNTGAGDMKLFALCAGRTH